jgi:endonuclease-8
LPTLKALWKDSIPLLRAGMVDRRIVTTRPKDRPTKKTGPPIKEEVHYVYRRHGKPCFVCGTKIQRQEIAGRSLYWCPVCQAG